MAFVPPTSAFAAQSAQHLSLYVAKSSAFAQTVPLTLCVARRCGSNARTSVVAAAALSDFAQEGIAFFHSIRIPASLVAGSSFAGLFALKDSMVDVNRHSKGEQFCIKAYHICILLAFTLAIATVAISTTAATSILHGRFNTMAETAYLFLKQEMEYEFVLTRWSFMMSLLLFLGGVANRAILEFDLLRKEKRDGLLAVLFSWVALIAHLTSLINGTLYCWKNILGMTVHVLRLSIRRGVTGKPLELVSLLSAFGAAFFLLKDLFFPKRS